MILIVIVQEFLNALDKNVLIATVPVMYTHKTEMEVARVIASVQVLINVIWLPINV